jgi:hypothetical protein
LLDEQAVEEEAGFKSKMKMLRRVAIPSDRSRSVVKHGREVQGAFASLDHSIPAGDDEAFRRIGGVLGLPVDGPHDHDGGFAFPEGEIGFHDRIRISPLIGF